MFLVLAFAAGACFGVCLGGLMAAAGMPEPSPSAVYEPDSYGPRPVDQ